MNIALLGACASQVSALAAVLNAALPKPSRPKVFAVAGTAGLPPDWTGFKLVLLMGLESAPHCPRPTQTATATAGDDALETADRSIRAVLAQAALPYQVLYGTQQDRLALALQAISRLDDGGPLAASSSPRLDESVESSTRPWVWRCDNCSDPQCERRLLTALLAAKSLSPAT